jgi:MFS superfamily sulfate permease-like transporter
MEKINKLNIPFDGYKGLKQNFSSDALSGFLVFLLALPLSLGIATASGFDAIYGLITAMIGGIVVSFFSGSLLTIKGPAAGLIVIVAGAVAEFGLGAPKGSSTEQIATYGWQLALGAIVVAGLFQIAFGILKLGSLSDFFPLSAVHGMLAAIGIIIISKQIHILLGFNPVTSDGKPMVEPIELLLELKNTFGQFFLHKDVVFVGLLSLAIVFGWSLIPIKALKKIPAALVVLIVSIPMSYTMGLVNEPDTINAAGNVVKGYKPLLEFKKGLIDILGVKVSFSGLSQTGTFVKYVLMFAVVGSLEALLTIKAIDIVDPFKRKSNTNKDLIAVGIGNVVAGVLGGLPMISEVARSSANVSNGAKTRWANLFHGIFILLFLIFAVSFSNMIPKSALAAMLIGIGWKLAHPREFGHRAKIGADQIAVFIVTIIFTLATDILLGIAAGILLKLVLHISRGVSFISLFNAKSNVVDNTVIVNGAAVFSNFVKVKNQILKFNYDENVILDVRSCKLVDHSVIETLHHLKDDFESEGGSLTILGIDEFRPAGNSKHPLSVVVKNKK